jgi:hypothetical protein
MLESIPSTVKTSALIVIETSLPALSFSVSIQQEDFGDIKWFDMLFFVIHVTFPLAFPSTEFVTANLLRPTAQVPFGLADYACRFYAPSAPAAHPSASCKATQG